MGLLSFMHSARGTATFAKLPMKAKTAWAWYDRTVSRRSTAKGGTMRSIRMK